MSVMLIPWILLAALLHATFPAEMTQAGDDKEMKAAVTRVEERLKELNAHQPTITPITDEAVTKSLPGVRVVSVRFRQYPVAMLAPEPLKSQNLFLVPQKGKMEEVASIDALETALKEHVGPSRGEPAIKNAVRTWLRLSEELKQDGFYKFELIENTLSVARRGFGWQGSGRTEVKSGGKGEFNVTMDFGPEGKLAKAVETSTVKPGVRPICQATKLLDRDPIVRRMAEQDILVMGRAAKPYLDQQRAKAGPELRRAIDRVWQRIVTEGW